MMEVILRMEELPKIGMLADKCIGACTSMGSLIQPSLYSLPCEALVVRTWASSS
jgi:hypothetical protein